MNQRIIILLSVIVLVIFSGSLIIDNENKRTEINKANIKIEFLENELVTFEIVIYEKNLIIDAIAKKLAQRNMEYEWLSEIADSIVYGQNNNFTKQFDEFLKSREITPPL